MSNLYFERLNNQTLRKAIQILYNIEQEFTKIIKNYGSPPLWDREPGFSTLVRIILEQQVSLSSARAAYNRLQNYLIEVNPDNFLQLNDQQLLSIGFSRQKRVYCRNLAYAIQKGQLDLNNHRINNDRNLRNQLLEIKGIGEWTTDIYFLMALGRPDIWPRSDLALAQAVQDLYQLAIRPGPMELAEISLKWKPWRAVAARILWHFYLSQRATK
jgi:DNA-3-methyladenine glycosylase II